MQLENFNNRGFDRGRSWLVEAMWRTIEGLLVNSWLPGSRWRVVLLKLFGAKIGLNVIVKPYVRVKFPWKLQIGDSSWIGENAWIDNLEKVTLGNDSCISQGVYLCTGNHRWDSDSFDLEVKPIVIGNHCWVGAKAIVAPGVVCGDGAVLTMGSLAITSLDTWTVYGGTPAQIIGPRNNQFKESLKTPGGPATQ